MKSKYCMKRSQDIVYKENERFQLFLKQNTGKKICILYGNCHITAICDVLQAVPGFLKMYAIFPVKAIQEVDDPVYFQTEAFQSCDVFIHQSIQVNNRYGKEYASINIIKRLKKDCQIIAIPNLYHLPMCFFPQYTNQEEFMWKGSTIFFRDVILDYAFINSISLEQTLRLYNDKNESGDLWRNFDLDKLFDTFLQKVQMREMEWDVKITDYILENYQKQQLFYDPNHPTSAVIKQISMGIMDSLGVWYEKEQIDFLDILRLDAYEMPISNVVKDYFAMDFEQAEMRLTGKKVAKIPMDLKNYILEYWAMEWQNKDVAFLKRIKSLCSFFQYKIYNKYLQFKNRRRK